MSNFQKKTELDCIEMMPKGGVATSAIIWLHGLGADGNDFISLVDELQLPVNHQVKFIFPTADKRPVTINGGMSMNAWYDVTSLETKRDEDIQGIKNTNLKIHNLINKEKNKGISTNQIILGGFSQGGAMSIYSGLRYPHQLGGIIALSSYCLLSDTLPNEKSEANNNVPLFLAHGTFDPIVHFALGKEALNLLENENYKVSFKSYPMEHTVCLEEVNDVSKFVRKVLNY